MRRMTWMLAVVLLTAAAAWAQTPGPGGGPGGDFQQRIARNPKFRLMDTILSLGELTKSTKCPLTAEQSKKVLETVKALQRKPKLTEEDAKATLKALKVGLTTRQLTEIGRLTRERRERMMARFRQNAGFGGGKGGPGMGGFGGGKGGPGMGGFGKGGPGMGGFGGGKGGPGMGVFGKGGPGMGGAKGGFDPNQWRDFNFFAPPPADNEFGQRMYRPLRDTITALEQKAKGK